MTNPEPPRGASVVLRRADGREVPLRAARWGDGFVVAVTGPDPAWIAEILATGRALVWTDAEGAGTVRPVREIRDPAEVADASRALRLALGEELWTAHFGSARRWLAIGPTTSRPDGDGRDEVRVEFDALAPFYDERLRAQPVQRYLRHRALDILHAAFPLPASLMELGSGTGAQTLPMLRRGHRILAVDISAEMRDRLQRRAEDAGVADRLVARVGTAQSIGAIFEEERIARLDGAYALFGPIDLDRDPGAMAGPLARTIRPGGRLVLGFLQRRAIVPAVEHAIAGHPRAGIARLGSTARVEAWARTLTVRRRSVPEIAACFAPEFELERTEPISVFAPPFRIPSAERFFGEDGLARLAAIDRRWSARGRLGWGADQLVGIFRRRPARPEDPPKPE